MNDLHTTAGKPFKRPALRLSMIAVHVLLLQAGVAHAQSADTNAAPAAATASPSASGTSNIGTVTITGDGDNLGTGLMVREDEPKTRSTVTRAEIEKERATGNVFQSIGLLPGVSTYSYDASGLFGGGLSIRGFNSDQIGFTINGVPVNDSGSFAVYPQEFLDNSNTCGMSVTQGATDLDAPHVGSTGGNVSIVTCEPENEKRVRVSQTVGGLNLTNSFVRLDSGRFANDMAKIFVSYSHAEIDKWKGEGKAKRDHVDFGFRLDLNKENYVTGTLNYNRAINNNIYNPSLAQLNQNGYYGDYASQFVGHLPPVKGTAQNEASQSPAYYKLSQNPFENVIASVTGVFRLTPTTQVKIQPYYWYGFGTGGTQQYVLSETGFLNPATGKAGLGRDLNGDGDTLDKIIVANSSVTRTDRPGITTTVTQQLGNHQIQAGVWFERAVHRQTGPAVLVNADGTASDIWLQDNQITGPTGQPYESRNWKTVSTSWQFFAADSISMLADKLNVTAGFRTPHVRRDFTNFANEGSNSGTSYNVVKDYNAFLPQAGVRYSIDDANQVYASYAMNFRAPPNFAFSPTNGNVTFVNGQATVTGNVKAETSNVYDIGYRNESGLGVFSGSLFYVDYKNRQATAYDPNLNNSVYTNAGRVRNYGFQLEFGTVPFHGWSAYASITNNHSRQLDNLQTSATTTMQTSGKDYPLDPSWLLGLSIQYAQPKWYVRAQTKFTARQYATLMNDEVAPSYTTVDLDAGYRFNNTFFFKNPTVRVNVSNLFNRQYRNPSSVQVGGGSGTVYYYLGAPRLLSVSLSADFQ
ncbi:TonB-dependent receptor [Pandoraea norimbergensis]|uniref:TonB-dependent receptor n=1 Tax=Pandoraea norimbergensis TaxID=93219 RepID=A0ABN4JH86_9BURK|nr:TonB-dependent receptor [Pandoraea norimbergensis]ALS59348.1 TonB-dependent receptor [Pandoraea norimbergensis]